MTHTAYLLLGSNLGNRKQILKNAATNIEAKIGSINVYSSIYETLAWGIEEQPAFLNQVIEVNTKVNPQELLASINSIETELGRVRHEKWGERLIDIDILYFDNMIVNAENLIIPHPEIANRRFTLIPLIEIAAELTHPVLGKSQNELLANCKDELEVKKHS